jgi:hypothetical protein
MWLRDLKILKQTKKSDNIFVTLFELVTWTKKTRYHVTVHHKVLSKEDFEREYHQRDYNYFTLSKAEMLYNLMINSDVKIESTKKLKSDDNTRKEVLPRGYQRADNQV